MTGFFAVVCLALSISFTANASSEMQPYMDGDLKDALKSGETVLLHYKSTW